MTTTATTTASPPARRGVNPRGRLATLGIMAVTAAVIVGAAFLSNRPTSASGVTAVTLPGGATGPAPVVGKPAPAFAATTAAGQPVNLAEYAGSPIWLTFGASWCQPCRAENPDIQAAFNKVKAQGVVVILVYMAEDATAVKGYTSRVGVTYVAVPDPDYAVSDEYRILGIPSHFFIDRTGVLRQVRVGTLDPDSMDAILTQLAG